MPLPTTNDPAPSCIACDGNSLRPVPNITRVVRPVFRNAQVIQCSNCGQGRLDPFPTFEETVAIYSNPEYVAAYDAAGQSFVVADADAQSLLKDRFDRLRTYLPEQGKLLDVGASRGIFLNAARKEKWDVHGLEAGADAIAHANKTYGIAIEHGTLESTPVPENSFDCIHLSHVLEHMHNPIENLTKIYRSLRPGGVLVVEVPYEFGDLFDRFRELLLRRPRTPNTVPSSHLYFFTRRTLCRVLERCGFEILRSATPRRNQSYDSKIPLGGWFKRQLYQLEQKTGLGPLIEVYARRPIQNESSHA